MRSERSFSLVTLAFLAGVLAEPPDSLSDGADTLVLVMIAAHLNPPDCWRTFGIRGCRISFDERERGRADALFIRHIDVISKHFSLPREPRPSGQKWIWFHIQPPPLSAGLWNYEDLYNLTLSYREDSDIAVPHGYLIPNALLDVLPRDAAAVQLSVTSDPRPGLASWVVSHWDEDLERVRLYKILFDHMEVDIFGSAGKRIPAGRDSVVELIKGYRFYLAFENSQHADYITEKLWNAVIGGAIPVVLGPSRRNYERFLPPEAFIHVDDFPSVRRLAKYLLKVKDSPPLIEMHLGWRRRYSVYSPVRWEEFYCTACRAVRMRKGRTDSVRNITGWWYYS